MGGGTGFNGHSSVLLHDSARLAPFRRSWIGLRFIFFSVLGGIQIFGLIGFIMGPMVLAVFFAILDIFLADGSERLGLRPFRDFPRDVAMY